MTCQYRCCVGSISVKGGAHKRYVDLSGIAAALLRIWAPTLMEVLRFSGSNAVTQSNIRWNNVRFLPHILYDTKFSKVFGSALYIMSWINDLIIHICASHSHSSFYCWQLQPCHARLISTFMLFPQGGTLSRPVCFFFSIGAYQLCVSPPHWQKQWRLKLLWKSAFAFNSDR